MISMTLTGLGSNAATSSYPTTKARPRSLSATGPRVTTVLGAATD